MVQWDDTTFGFFTSSVVNPTGLLFDQLTMAIKLSQSDDESKKGKERRVSSQRLVRLIFCMSLIYVGREVIFNPYLSYLEITPKDDQSTSGTTGTVEDIGRRLDLAIFYNIFISPKNVDLGLSIVQEQLDLRKRHPHLSNVPLYYTKIGAHNYSFPRSCEPCEELTAVEDGTEQITLQFLYEYCQRYPTTGRVIYIHNKGSFTNTPTNERLRITLTRGFFRRNVHRCRKASVIFVLPNYH